MTIKPSSLLNKDYSKMPNTVHEAAEPIYITHSEMGDTVVLSVAAYEEMKSRVSMLQHCVDMLSVEAGITRDAKTYSSEEVRQRINEKYFKGIYDAKK